MRRPSARLLEPSTRATAFGRGPRLGMSPRRGEHDLPRALPVGFHARGGFTLAEMLTTVVIVAVMAAMAVPQYQRTMEIGYWRSARDVLQAIYSGEQVYWNANNRYVLMPPTDLNWGVIYMDNPDRAAVTYTVVTNGAIGPQATFTATATRVGGPCGGRTQTIDQARATGGTWVVNGATATSGGGNAGACL